MHARAVALPKPRSPMQRGGAAPAAAPLSPIASRRIQAELREWMTSPPDCWCLVSGGDAAGDGQLMRSWDLLLQGTGLYDGEVFTLRVVFGSEYPMHAPEFVFLAPAPKHPHIYSNGHICLDILYNIGAWSPALTIASVARSLQSMLLTSPGKSAPPGDEDYCRRVGSASSQHTRWAFHDDTV